jgi:hypothetical protein
MLPRPSTYGVPTSSYMLLSHYVRCTWSCNYKEGNIVGFNADGRTGQSRLTLVPFMAPEA